MLLLDGPGERFAEALAAPAHDLVQALHRADVRVDRVHEQRVDGLAGDERKRRHDRALDGERVVGVVDPDDQDVGDASLDHRPQRRVLAQHAVHVQLPVDGHGLEQERQGGACETVLEGDVAALDLAAGRRLDHKVAVG